MNNILISGSGYAVAGQRITNDDLAQVVDTSNQWIVTRTGIHSRYVSTDENTSQLAYRAAVKAIENSGIDKNEIDLIIVATMTADNFTPSTACLVQDMLGLNGNHVMAFDVNAACSGFLYAAHIAAAMLGQYKCALVIGAETLSKLVDWTDRNTCVLFGDGAGAFVMQAADSEKQLYFYAQSIGDSSGTLQAAALPMHPALQNTEKTFGYLQMDGNEVFRFAIRAMEQAIAEALTMAGRTIDEIDLIIPHQANMRIISHVARRMKLPLERFFTNLADFGNTSAASIPIAFAQAHEQGLLKQGMKIILVGFGGGFTYGSAYLEL